MGQYGYAIAIIVTLFYIGVVYKSLQDWRWKIGQVCKKIEITVYVIYAGVVAVRAYGIKGFEDIPTILLAADIMF